MDNETAKDISKAFESCLAILWRRSQDKAVVVSTSENGKLTSASILVYGHPEAEEIVNAVNGLMDRWEKKASA